jgi:hypothetical protein
MGEKPPTVRDPPHGAVEEAKNNPGGWVYEIRGSYGPDEHVPPHAVVGAWKVGEDGKIVGEFIPNPNFREVPDQDSHT